MSTCTNAPSRKPMYTGSPVVITSSITIFRKSPPTSGGFAKNRSRLNAHTCVDADRPASLVHPRSRRSRPVLYENIPEVARRPRLVGRLRLTFRPRRLGGVCGLQIVWPTVLRDERRPARSIQRRRLVPCELPQP